jgi:uncharacterized Zn finger protein (UPF0148 family)
MDRRSAADPMGCAPSPQRDCTAGSPETVQCPKCGGPLAPTPANGSSVTCPECGSALWFKDLHARVEVKGHSFRRARHPGVKANYDVQTEEGDSFHRKTVRWHRLTRIIDRLRDRYYEHVTDAETGTVLRHVDERLSEHRSRRSTREP